MAVMMTMKTVNLLFNKESHSNKTKDKIVGEVQPKVLKIKPKIYLLIDTNKHKKRRLSKENSNL